MSEDDDLLDSSRHPPPRLVHPTGIEGEAPTLAAAGGDVAGEESVLPREGEDGGRVESVDVADGMKENSRLGFANSGDGGGEVVKATGFRTEQGNVDGDDGSIPRIEAFEGVEGGVVEVVADETGCSLAAVVEEECREGDGVVGAQVVGEVKDASGVGVRGVDSGLPPAEAMGEKPMDKAKDSELERASCTSLPGFSCSFPRAKVDVDGTWQIEGHLRDDAPVLLGCNKDVKTNHPHREASEEVVSGNVVGFGCKIVEVNFGEHGYPTLLGSNEEVRMGHLQFEASEEVNIGNVEEFGGKKVDGNEGKHGQPMTVICDEEQRIGQPHGEASKEVEVGNVDGFGGKNVAGNVSEPKSVMLNDMDESLPVISRLAPIVELEQEMVDAYGSHLVKVPTADDNVMSADVSPRSDVKEDAASGAKMDPEIHDMDDSKLSGSSVPLTPGEEEDAAALASVSVANEDAMLEDMAMAEEKELSADVSVRGGRKKRGRPPRTQSSKAQSKKKVEEDVCFICFDGGDLVVCDRRGCPKVYHPSCVNRDEAFFRAKGRWNCGWHICSICEKSSQFMCYTCTYSLCKGCVKGTGFVCIRGYKGLCETCRGMVMLVETNEQENKTVVNFDDKSSWEFLFRDYWFDVKAQFAITLDEITQAKNPLKRSLIPNDQSSDEIYEAHDVVASSSDSSSGHHVKGSSSKKRVKRKSKAAKNDENIVNIVDSVGSSMPGDGEWASKELLEFVLHMRGGDASILTQFDVQALLLEYIKRNNLRDPRKKSQIICDSRLKNLFGKARVGHFEMLKLLESHFLIKEASQAAADDEQGVTGDIDGVQIDLEGSSVAAGKNLEKRRKSRKKEERGLENNFSDYAAVDIHNVSLVYLRRNLMEDLIDDVENFHEKAVGAFVRIRISGTGQKQDMYRIVQVVGTTKAAEIYKTGKKTTDIALEILNLNKTEVITIDSISNQEFTEEECKRLRQSIKCGFICPMTVGELQEKAIALQAVRVNDWLESEKLRLGHLRDRASEKGRRKELRECVEKLQLLNTPEEHSRRLNEIPKIHTDPKMDPAYESAEEESDDRKRDNYSRPRDSGSARKGRELMSSGKNLSSSDGWNVGKGGASFAPLEPGRNVSRDAYNYIGDKTQEPVETPRNVSRTVNAWSSNQTVAGTGQSAVSTLTTASAGTGLSTATSINEAEKIWHYQDPSGKIQGPFSMVQLRKWNSTGYFPRDLKIWKTSENQEDSILLTDALIGKVHKELPKSAMGMDKLVSAQSNSALPTRSNWDLPTNFASTSGLKHAHGNPLSAVAGPSKPLHNADAHDRKPGTSVETWKADGSLLNSGNNSSNLSAPTPKPSAGGWAGGHGLDNNWASGQSMNARCDANSNQSANAYHSLPAAFQLSSPSTGWVDKSSVLPDQSEHTERFVLVQTPSQTDGFCGSQKNAPPEYGPHPEVSNQGEIRHNIEISKYQGLECPSPTPNNDWSKNFPMDGEQQKNFASTGQNERTADTPAASTGGSLPNKIVDLDGMKQAQFQSSGNRKSLVTTSSDEWSMPSPTPTSSSGVDTSAKASQVHTPVSTQWQSNASFEASPQTTADQDSGTQSNANNAWGSAQGNTTISWEALTQINASLSSANPANGGASVNMGWDSAIQSIPTGNMVWMVPGQVSTDSTGWGAVVQGNPNANTLWRSVAPVNANLNSNWQALAQGYPNMNPSWVAPTQENAGPNGSWAASGQMSMNANAGWGTPAQGNPNGSGYVTGNGNVNAGWKSPSGNYCNNRDPHHREDRDRHSGHGDRRFLGRERGHGGGGRQRTQFSSGSSRQPEGGRRGVCKFHESGHCRRGTSCNFIHT